MAEPFQFHLLKLARAEDEIARRDFIAEGLADLGDTEGHAHTAGIQHVLEIREDTAAGFGAQIDFVFLTRRRAREGVEHHVELAGFGQRAGFLGVRAENFGEFRGWYFIKRGLGVIAFRAPTGVFFQALGNLILIRFLVYSQQRALAIFG